MNKLFKFCIIAPIFYVFLFIIVLFSSCSISDPEPINEEEVIDRVVLSVTERGTTTTQLYVWETSSTLANIILSKNKIYDLKVSFINSSNNSDITQEVIAEKDEHFVQYSSTISQLSLVRSSTDYVRADGKKLGIYTTITTGNTNSIGNLEVSLIHSPITVEDSNGFGASTGGETDVQVSYNLTIN